MDRAYLCIDLKCFYASVECVDRGRDPFEHRLVVADPSRGRKTICLAISPAMKALGVRNRCRVFEIPDGIDYEMARPRMRRYMEVSADIYARYLRYFSPEDIHVYSVDEVFIDVTPYLALYGKTARELAVELIDMVRRETGICATAGIGTNLFLAKVALDITAKHTPDNIGELDEERYKCLIWHHRPITDIWGIGPGIARRLAQMGAHDMGGVALLPERALYDEFGINAELLIDHAWGIEPCTMAQIHAYQPKAHSMGSGQVLMRDYAFEEARVVLREMVDNLTLELVDKGLVCGHVSLFVGYAHERGSAGERGAATETFTGEHGRQRLAQARRGHELAHGAHCGVPRALRGDRGPRPGRAPRQHLRGQTRAGGVCGTHALLRPRGGHGREEPRARHDGREAALRKERARARDQLPPRGDRAGAQRAGGRPS